MADGVRGLSGYSAQPHAVQELKNGLVPVTTLKPRAEAMLAMANQSTIRIVLWLHVHVYLFFNAHATTEIRLTL